MKAFKSTEGRQSVVNYYNMLLGSLHVRHEEKEIVTEFGNTHLLMAGNGGTPLVLLHGSSFNSSMWIGDMNTLAQNRAVYAPDMPGEAGQSDENQLPFDTDDYPNWLYGLLSAIGLKKIQLAGASLGGWLAVKFATQHPEMVEKLLLFCPAGIGSQNDAFKETALSLLPKGEAGVDELLRRVSGGTDVPKVVLDYQKLIFSVFNARQEAIPRFTDAQLLKLAMPLRVFVGDGDIMLRSDETKARLESLLPHAEVTMLPGYGHSLSGLVGQYAPWLDRDAESR
jgi:pimeloyl-ACP methyl ester carboxylesterase